MGLEQKAEVMKLLDQLCHPLISFDPKKYSYERAPEYLKKLDENITDCCISEKYLNVALNPKFFTENYELVKDIFPSTAWRLRNWSHRDCVVNCGNYCLELYGDSLFMGGIIKKDEMLVSLTFGDPEASYGTEVPAGSEHGLFYGIPKTTSTDSGREFMELLTKPVRKAAKDTIKSIVKKFIF